MILITSLTSLFSSEGTCWEPSQTAWWHASWSARTSAASLADNWQLAVPWRTVARIQSTYTMAGALKLNSHYFWPNLQTTILWTVGNLGLNLSRKLVNLVYLVYFAFIFTIFKYVTLCYIKSQGFLDPEAHLSSKVVNSKPELLACAAHWNPFRSQTFAWVDAGVARPDGNHGTSWHLFFCDSPGIHPSSYAWTSLPMAFWRSTSFLVKAVAYPENSCNIT